MARLTGTIVPFIIVTAISMTWSNAASSKVHLYSSFQSSPSPVASFGSKLPWTLSLAFHLTVTSDAERDQRQPRTLGWELLRSAPHKRPRVAQSRLHHTSVNKLGEVRPYALMQRHSLACYICLPSVVLPCVFPTTPFASWSRWGSTHLQRRELTIDQPLADLMALIVSGYV